MSLSQEVISSFINWLEREVTAENHQAIRKRLLQEISSYVQNNIHNVEIIHPSLIYQINELIHGQLVNISDFDFENKFRSAVKSKLDTGINSLYRDDDITNVAMELLALDHKNHNLKLIISENFQSLIKINIEKLQETASWTGSKSEIRDAQIISRLSFFSLNIGILERDYVESLLKKMIDSIPSSQWFSSSSEIYGKSFFLRSIIFLCINDPRHDFYDYLKIVCEQLLRRMEIRCERTILSTKDNFHLDICLLEQLRLNKAVMEVGEVFNDLRFLNAAMKSNDRIYNIISKIKISSKKTQSNVNNITIALYYNDVVNLQEKLYGSLK